MYIYIHNYIVHIFWVKCGFQTFFQVECSFLLLSKKHDIIEVTIAEEAGSCPLSGGMRLSG